MVGGAAGGAALHDPRIGGQLSLSPLPCREIALGGAAAAAMPLSLRIHRRAQFFWLRKIRAANIHECCARCFVGESDGRLFNATRGRSGEYPLRIRMDVAASPRFVAYYLCGVASTTSYEANTHVAFLYAPGEFLSKETERIHLEIGNARLIDFEGYSPDPPGRFSEAQRRCRNWRFACYVNDGMLPRIGG